MPQCMTREYCLAKADECRREAEKAADKGTRRAFEHYVRHWLKLADGFPDPAIFRPAPRKVAHRSR